MRSTKIKLYTIILIGLSCWSTTLWSQQEVNYALYRYHFNLINPAVTGSQGAPFVNLSVRAQWVGIQEAPETQAISFGTPSRKERLGIGFSIINDKLYVESQTQFFADFSYRLPMGDSKTLYLGIKAGGTSLRVNADNLVTYQGTVADPFLVNTSNFVPNVGIGVYYKTPEFFFSASIPRVLKTKRFRDQDGQVTRATDNPHIFVSSGYSISFLDQWKFTPSVLFSYVSAAPIQLLVDGVFSFNDVFDVGAQYSVTGGLGGTAFFKATKGIYLGYAYLGQSGGANSLSVGTHEFVLKIKIGKSSGEKAAEAEAEAEAEGTENNTNN